MTLCCLLLYLVVMHINLESLVNVTMFILATTKLGNDGKSLFETRSHPLINTWGSYFKNIFFVIGFDRNEVIYLKKNCDLFRKFVDVENITSSTKQESIRINKPFSRNFLYEYKCPIPIIPLASDHVNDISSQLNSSSRYRVLPSNFTSSSITVLLTGI